MVMDIVVASCVKYSDAWGPFVALFRRFWPSCPYRLILLTDGLDRQWNGDRVINLGADQWWSKNLEIGLSGLHSDHVLLMQEDFFLSGPVDEAFIHARMHLLQQDPAIVCFRLMPCPGSDISLDNDFGAIAQDAPYRVSCQAAIWRREFLCWLLSQTRDCADFELNGTKLTRDLPETFLSVCRDRIPWPLPYLVSAISRGVWNPDAIALCQKFKIPIDLSKRPVG